MTKFNFKINKFIFSYFSIIIKRIKMDLSMTEKRGMRPENRVFYENIFKLIDTDGGGGKPKL
jgi:hypothetical protein